MASVLTVRIAVACPCLGVLRLPWGGRNYYSSSYYPQGTSTMMAFNGPCKVALYHINYININHIIINHYIIISYQLYHIYICIYIYILYIIIHISFGSKKNIAMPRPKNPSWQLSQLSPSSSAESRDRTRASLLTSNLMLIPDSC